MPSIVDSAYDSPHTANCDPIIYGESSLSDLDFGSLFATDGSTPDDAHFFKDGFAAGNNMSFDNNDTLAFDSLVDFDAGHNAASNSSGTASTSATSSSSDDFASGGDSEYLDGSLFETSDPLAPSVAMSAAQQPILGAPA